MSCLNERVVAMSAILLGVAVAILDVSMVNVALPRIAFQLNVAAADSIFIVNAYQISMVASLLVFSALGDAIGYKVIYMLGSILFSVSSFACSITTSFDHLVLVRALQGLGGSAMTAVNIAIIRSIYPAHQFGRAIGFSALVVALSFCAGPLISSIILSYGSWPLIFFLNFIIGAVVFIIIAAFLPNDHRKNPIAIPWLDFFVVVAGLFLIAFSLAMLGLSGYGNARFIAGGASFAIGLAIILFNSNSFIKFLPHPYSKVKFITAVFITTLGYMAQGSALISLPFFFSLSYAENLPKTVTALVFWALFSGIAAYFSGRASDKWNSVHLLGGGLFFMFVGIALLAISGAGGALWLACVCAAVAGTGFGIFQTPNLKLILSYSPIQESGRSNGVLATLRLLGQMAGGVIAAGSLSLSAEQGAQWALIASALCAFSAFALANMQRVREP